MINKIRCGTAALLILCLLAVSGCGFFGGDEPVYSYWEPVLSPDGATLAYESTTESGLELFLLNLGTNEEQQITDNEYADWSPSWSLDGTQIAFASSREENVDIYVIDLDSLDVVRVTTHSADDINPSWGLDNLIYFNSNRTETWEAYSIRPDGLELRKLTSLDTPLP